MELQKINSNHLTADAVAASDLGLTPEAYLNNLSPIEIGIAFDRLEKFAKFCNDTLKIIEKQVKDGTVVPGLQLMYVESKPTEGFIADEKDIAAQLNAMGYSDDVIYKPKSLVSWTTVKALVKTTGVNKLKDAGLVGTVRKDPTLKVVYVGTDTDKSIQ